MVEVHEGGCVCGAVRYRTRGEPKRAALCACTWCQKRSGSAFGVSVYFDEDDIDFHQGTLNSYLTASDADRRVEAGFCPVCGTTVTWTLELRPGLRGIAGGTFDQPTFWYDLDAFVFTRSKPDWVVVPEGVEFHETAPYHPSMAGRED